MVDEVFVVFGKLGDERQVFYYQLTAEGHAKDIGGTCVRFIPESKLSSGVLVNGIKLHSIGSTMIVSAEIDGRWVEVIRDIGSTISHIVEPAGIRACVEALQS